MEEVIQMVDSKKRNGVIDILRVVMAVLVITIHTAGTQKELSLIASSIARLAVPFFMCTTSYYFFSKNRSKDEVVKTIKKLLIIWLFWMIIYLPRLFFSLKNTSFSRSIYLIMRGFFGGSVNYGGSWYLLATAFGILVIWWGREKNLNGAICFFSTIIFLGVLITTSYGGWITPNTLLYTLNDKLMLENTVVMGIPWIYFGSLISKYSFKSKLSFTLLFVALLLPIFEYVILKNYHFSFVIPDGRTRTDVMLTLPISIFLIFKFTNTVNLTISKDLSSKCRDLSALVFFIHFGVNFVFSDIFKVEGGFSRFILVLMISLTISIIYMIISRIKIFNWMRLGY